MGVQSDYLGSTADGVDIYDTYQGNLYYFNKCLEYFEMGHSSVIHKIDFEVNPDSPTSQYYSTPEAAQEAYKKYKDEA